MERARAIRLLLLAGGAGWLSGAAVTGQRLPGASFAWALPASAGFALCVLALVAVWLAARWAGSWAPAREVERAALPLWACWALAAVLVASADANHYFANWPRLRVAALVAASAACVAAAEVVLIRAFARGRGRPAIAPRRPGIPGLVFLGCLLAYVGSAGGHLYSADEWTIYATAVGLVEHGRPAAYDGQPYRLTQIGTVARLSDPPPDATRAYTKYGIAPSLAAAPLYLLARLTGNRAALPAAVFPFPLDNLARPLVPLLFGPLVSAAIAALLYRTAVDLGYALRPALWAAAGVAVGSLIWPYAKTMMNMNPAALALLAALWLVIRAQRSAEGPRQTAHACLVAAGACGGIAAASRYEMLLLILPVWLLAGKLAGPRAAGRARGLLAFGGGLALASVPLVFGVNLVRTGSVLNFGYGGEGTAGGFFLEKPWWGIFGELLSPGCGLVTHTPLMALGIIALVWFWEDAPGPALACGATVLAAILYYGSGSTTWCAPYTWGSRYLTAVAPFMALPLAALWTRLRHAGRNPFAWLVVGGTWVWSAATNLLAVLIDFNRGWQDHWAHNVTYLEIEWLPFFAGITSHQRLLREWLLDGTGGLDLYLLNGAGPAGPLLLAVCIAGSVACWTIATVATSHGKEVPREV